jgi:dipeptidyl aminopeptidase/acylaminoacyl peptidase
MNQLHTLAAAFAAMSLVGLPLASAAQDPAARAFTAHDLNSLARLSDVQLTRDGASLAYTLRETDWEANRGVRSVWRLSMGDSHAAPVRLTAAGSNAWSPRWSPDGHTLYFLSDRSGSAQLWRLADGRGEALPVTRYPLDVLDFVLSPDGHQVAFSLEVFTDCADLACTKQRLADRVTAKTSGMLFREMFVRHWDSWGDGRRHQLFVAQLDADGTASAEPRRLSRGIEGDVPSKPFGDDTEYRFSPDGRTVYFGARVAGASEPWSTNFDVYAAATDGAAAPRNLTPGNPAWDAYPLPAPDGRRLYYLAMARPGFEADRFAIMELDLQSGARREVAPLWDRSPGALAISDDGRTLYASADDQGDHPLFAVDTASGAVHRTTGSGEIQDFTLGGGAIVVARGALDAPADAYRVLADGRLDALTAVNAERMKGLVFAAPEAFQFSGWNGERVRGYVVKPAGYAPGRKYPVAFLIHGGPQGSWLNDFHYRWNPQVFAAAGFAVVAIDFHGSTGYGQAFTDSISGHWGDRPLEDLQRGWKAALGKFAFLDGGRACALGASFGGYMINWIAGNWNTPASGAWRCLVSHDGDFDNRMMSYATEELWFSEWETPGTPWDHAAQVERFNPILHVADWKVPMMVIHGALDYRVPLEEGLGAFTALQRRGVPSQLLVFPDENHWVLKPRNSVQWNEEVLAWLRRWTSAP